MEKNGKKKYYDIEDWSICMKKGSGNTKTWQQVTFEVETAATWFDSDWMPQINGKVQLSLSVCDFRSVWLKVQEAKAAKMGNGTGIHMWKNKQRMLTLLDHHCTSSLCNL